MVVVRVQEGEMTSPRQLDRPKSNLHITYLGSLAGFFFYLKCCISKAPAYNRDLILDNLEYNSDLYTCEISFTNTYILKNDHTNFNGLAKTLNPPNKADTPVKTIKLPYPLPYAPPKTP